MEKVAVFPGSFDPFTLGHEAVVRRALHIFDKIIIAIGVNSNKPDFFPIEKRIQWIKETFKDGKHVSVMNYEGLTIDFCKSVNAKIIIRGIRTSADFEYERSIAHVNYAMAPEIETIFILTSPEHSAITSTLVRDIIRHGGDASKFLPNSEDLRNFRIK
jgi:pantetheine-phosphate adenylyltransferase